MRVALLTDGIYPHVIGGMQKHSFYLASYLAKNEIQVDLYHTANDLRESDALKFFGDERKNIRSFIVPFPRFRKIPGHYVRESYAYSRYVFETLMAQEQDYDFVYVQGLSGMHLLNHKDAVGCKIGVNFHGLEMFQQAPDLRSRLAQYLFRKPVLKCLEQADVVYSLGGRLTEILIQQDIPPSKISQIGIGIDPSWLREPPFAENKTIRFVFTGRYERRKGIEELSAVLSQMKDKPFQITLIGNIPADKKINAPNIDYTGNISDPETIKSILKTADVLICPSHSEGMPTVILEAMASGLGILATDVGAVSEQVDAGNGILIPPGNTGALEKGINAFIEMPKEKLMEMKMRSVEKIKERFLWEKVIEETIRSIS